MDRPLTKEQRAASSGRAEKGEIQDERLDPKCLILGCGVVIELLKGVPQNFIIKDLTPLVPLVFKAKKRIGRGTFGHNHYLMEKSEMNNIDKNLLKTIECERGELNPYGFTRWILRAKPQENRRFKRYSSRLNIQAKSTVLYKIGELGRVGSNSSIFNDPGHNLGTEKQSKEKATRTLGRDRWLSLFSPNEDMKEDYGYYST